MRKQGPLFFSTRLYIITAIQLFPDSVMFFRLLALVSILNGPSPALSAPFETQVLMDSDGWLTEKGTDLADGAQICRLSTRTGDGRAFEVIHHENGAGYLTISDANWQLAARTILVSLVVNQTEWQFYAVATANQIELQLAPSQVLDFKSDLIWGTQLILQNAAGEQITGFNTGNAKNATWAFGTCTAKRPTTRPVDPDPFD